MGRISQSCAAVFLAAVGSALVFPTAASAAGPSCISLGSAANYSEYTTSTASVLAETVAGPVAYGAATISASLFATTSTAPTAVNLVLGSSSTMSNSTLANGVGEYVGTLSGGGNTGSFTAEASQADLPIQFATTQSSLTSASSTIAALAPTNTASGTTTLSLTSTGSGTDVFDVTESQLSLASTIAINAPAGAVVVVNVSGSSGLSLSGQTVTLSGGVTAPDVMWNLASVSSASLSAENWSGTLLVPSGSLTMSANAVSGSVLSGGSTASLSANNVKLDLFAGCIANQPGSATPEAPLAILLPIAATGTLAGGVMWSRRRRRNLAAR